MEDFLKRHTAWVFVIILAALMSFLIFKNQTQTQSKIDSIIMNIDTGQTGQEGYSAIQALEAEKNYTAPLTVAFYAIIAVMLSIPLSGIVLYCYTAVPFLRYIIKGKNNDIDTWERKQLYFVCIGVFIGVCFILGCSILLLMKL